MGNQEDKNYGHFTSEELKSYRAMLKKDSIDLGINIFDIMEKYEKNKRYCPQCGQELRIAEYDDYKTGHYCPEFPVYGYVCDNCNFDFIPYPVCDDYGEIQVFFDNANILKNQKGLKK